MCFSFHVINPTALSSTFIYSPGTQLANLLFLHMHTDAARAEMKAKASVLFPELFSTSDSQQQVPCPPCKGWSIFHCLKLPRPQGAGGNKTIFDLAKGKILEVKGQNEEFITAAKAAKLQVPDQKLPSCSTCHAVQLPMCLGRAGSRRGHSQKPSIFYTYMCAGTLRRPLLNSTQP